jgi:hypothetical protein
VIARVALIACLVLGPALAAAGFSLGLPVLGWAGLALLGLGVTLLLARWVLS